MKKLLILISILLNNMIWSNNCLEYNEETCLDNSHCKWSIINNICSNFILPLNEINSKKELLEFVISLDDKYEKTDINEDGLIDFKGLTKIKNEPIESEMNGYFFKVDYFKDKELVKEIIHHDNGYINKISNYNNGKLDGIQVECVIEFQHTSTFFYYLRGTEQYKDGKKDGLEIVYFHNTNEYINQEKYYKDGKKDGKWVTYEPDNGFMILEENYNKGNRIGLSRSYFEENGVMSSNGYFKNGEKTGKWTWYHFDGSKMLERNYKDGKLIETKEY